MKLKSLVSVVFLLLINVIALSQNTYDIVLNAEDRKQKCEACTKAFIKKPNEVKFSVKRENTDLYFEINNKEWFDLLFKNSGDGLAIDIVTKDRYDCNLGSIKNSQIRGHLLKPVYSGALKNGIKSKGDQLYSVWVGKLPAQLIDKELEFNILFLGNKNLCQYNVLFNLESYAWELLDMGMYLDSLAFDTKQVKSGFGGNNNVRYRTLKFIIPFKKNNPEYSQADLKPLYDSLKLTDYNIKTINIKAYSSIEGITSRNLELQQLRANNIIKALQKFQKPTIKTNVASSENWVDFFNDIKDSKYANLYSLSKKEVKAKISGTLSRQMEPILKNHRKAVVELELETKDNYEGESVEVLLQTFNEAISSKNIALANDVQNAIFERLKAKGAMADIMQKLNIPKQLQFADILNKNAAFKYMLDKRYGLIVYDELQELEKLSPNDAKIKYNSIALKLNLWNHNAITVNEANLLSDINGLKKYGIDKSLVLRMLANFNIIKADKLARNRDFEAVDKAVAFVNKNCRNFPLSNYDYSSLSQFFGTYGNPNLAIELLENKARSIDIDEDLLFYYLNLTLVNKELTKDPNYRTVMLNAININGARFCKLFNSIDNGGVTFQLLEDSYLRNTYCENCNN